MFDEFLPIPPRDREAAFEDRARPPAGRLRTACARVASVAALALLSTAAQAQASLYLRHSGVPSSTMTAAAPTATTLANFDPGRDANPGLLLAKGGSGAGESDASKYQRWLGPVGAMVLGGTIELRLWSAIKDFSTGKRGALSAYLRNCNSTGGSCSTIGTATLSVANWNAAGTTWVDRSLNFGTVNAVLAADRRLELKLIVANDAGDDMWVAYDSTGYPSVLQGLAPPGVDHYELALPAASISCLPSTVTVTACADSSSPCTNKSTGVAGATIAVSTNAGSLGGTTLTFDGTGTASTTLSHGSAGNGAVARVTLGSASAAASNGAKCCPDGVGCALRSYCDSSFSTAGFVIAAAANGASATIPTQTAGTASGSLVLRAVKTGTSTKACEAALTGTTAVNWATQSNDPATCQGNRLLLTGASTATIACNPASGVTATTAVNMSFDANGNAPFSFTYSDVGRITLSASKAAGGSLLTALSGSSNAFVVKPAGLVLSAIRCSSHVAGACNTGGLAAPGNNPGASNASGTGFLPAGRPFSVTVTAVDSGGGAVPNFGREASPEGVTLTATLVSPAGGSAGVLANPSAFGSFNGGAATGTAFSYSEAGVITLTPSLTSGSYLGSAGAVTGTTSGHVGRFYADHLTTTVTPACSGSFSYAGQPFDATVTARNFAGAALANYDATRGYAKAVTLSDGAGLGTGTLSGGGMPASAFSAGSAAAAPSYGYTTKLTAPGTLVLRAVDTDSASSSGHTEGSTVLRSGRLRLSNSYGRETTALSMAVQAEYWGGSSWLPNTSDSCTSLAPAAVGLSNQRGPTGAASSAWSTSASAITLAAGIGALTLAAPSPAGTGTIDVSLNLGSTGADNSCVASAPATTGATQPWLRSRYGGCSTAWDRDPSARASFGIFSPESRKTVHMREIF